MLLLTVVAGPDRGRTFRLEEGVPHLIGRSTGSVNLSDKSVSRRHAEITGDDASFSITDLGSNNGTIVDNNQATANEPVALRDGSTVVLGQTAFSVTVLAGRAGTDAIGVPVELLAQLQQLTQLGDVIRNLETRLQQQGEQLEKIIKHLTYRPIAAPAAGAPDDNDHRQAPRASSVGEQAALQTVEHDLDDFSALDDQGTGFHDQDNGVVTKDLEKIDEDDPSLIHEPDQEPVGTEVYDELDEQDDAEMQSLGDELLEDDDGLIEAMDDPESDEESVTLQDDSADEQTMAAVAADEAEPSDKKSRKEKKRKSNKEAKKPKAESKAKSGKDKGRSGKKSPVLTIVIIVIVLGAVGGGYFAWTQNMIPFLPAAP